MENIVLTREDKRKSGQFYTPDSIVEYMIDYLGLSKTSTILDPTCGCGAFLVKIAQHLNEKFHDMNLIKNVYGVDINKEAIKQTKTNLVHYAGNPFRGVINQNVRYGNAIHQNQNTFRWDLEFPDVFEKGGFDFVIGNPPYFTIKDENDFDRSNSVYSACVNGVVNAASLITATGYELLKEGGKLIFLLPKSLTRVKSYEKLREFLLDRSTICQIYDLGVAFDDVRGEQIILCFQKGKLARNDVEIRKFTKTAETLSQQPSVFIPQSEYAKLENFLILPNINLYKVAKNLANIKTTLADLCDGNIFRGISLNQNSKTMSGRYGVAGKMIAKFSLKDVFPIGNDLEGYVNKISLMKKPKILLQNIYSRESGVKTFYDESGLITAETVTNIIVDKVNPKFILAILNSKLMTFYLSHVVFNGSVLTMHTDREYIGKIPVVFPDKKTISKIVALISGILEDSENWKTEMTKVDNIIYEIYGIDKDDQLAIDKLLFDTMSQRSYW
jgi:tRNA1(Val) A37 N6-methylase TrmN6